MKKWSRILLILALVAALLIGGLMVRAGLSKPPQLGVADGKLTPCPASPNCVSTQATRDEQRAAAIPWDGDAAAAIQRLKTIVERHPRTRIVEASDNYLRAEFRSLIFRFVDDVEFYVDLPARQIHFRSASRTGYSDLGVNRQRMDRLRAEFLAARDSP